MSRFRISCCLVAFLLVAACGPKSDSKLKGDDNLVTCREDQSSAALGKLLGGFIDLGISLTGLVPAAAEGISGVTEISVGGTFAKLFGSGCDETAARLELFIKLTERRISELWTTVKAVETNDVSRDIVQEGQAMKSATMIIDQKIEEIKSSATYKNDRKVPESALGEIATQYITLSNQMQGIRKSVDQGMQLEYVAGAASTVIPLGIVAAQLSQNILVVVNGHSVTNTSILKNLQKNIEAFRLNYGNLLAVIKNKAERYPGQDFELMVPPNIASSTPASSTCSYGSQFAVKFDSKLLEYKILAFGRPFATNMVNISGQTINLDLKQKVSGCKDVFDHPYFSFAVASAVKTQSPEIKASVDAVKSLYELIDPVRIEKILKWLNWSPALRSEPSFKADYFKGYTKSGVFGSAYRGDEFSDLQALKSSEGKVLKLEHVTIKAGDRVDQVCITMGGVGEQCHGGSGGDNPPDLRLANGETIQKVYLAAQGYNGKVRIFGMKVTTSTGQSMAWGTFHDGDAMMYEFVAPAGRQIVGYYGRSGKEVDGVGVIYGPK